MPKIELKKLTILNYRNISYQQLEFDGSSKIVGENRIGKTNTIEALYWLLTDKLLNGSSDIIQIKPLDDTKKVVEVTADFDVNGIIISLGKNYKEEWTKTRGTDELVFKGHTTSYIYNGTKVGTKKEFDNLFAQDFGININKVFSGIDLVQMLINPLYLGRMGDTSDWTNLRKLIVDLVGDVADSDVFALNPVLEPIANDLKDNMGRTDMLTKRYRDQLAGLETDIKGLDAIILDLERTERPTDEELEVAKRGLEECNANIISLKGQYAEDKATAVIDKEILDLKNKIIERKRYLLTTAPVSPNEEKKQVLKSQKSEKSDAIQDLVYKKIKIQTEMNELEKVINNKTYELQERTKDRNNLIDQLKALDIQIANPTFETECPYCKQPYPAEKVEEIKEHVLKELTIKRVELINKGKANTEAMLKLKEEVLELSKQLEELKAEFERITSAITLLNKEIKEIENELSILDETPTSPIDFDNDKEVLALQKQIDAKEKEKADIRNSIAKRDESVSSLIAAEEEKRTNFDKVITQYNYWEMSQSRKEEKKVELSEKQRLLIQLEQKIEMIKAFVKRKLEMLDSNIERVFGDVKFMLIEPQVNGGYSTVCKPYIKGTNTLWKSGSKSEQITTGVAICERIKKELNLPDFPYIFDEGGEISNDTFSTRFETESQLICVQVKDNILKPMVVKI